MNLGRGRSIELRDSAWGPQNERPGPRVLPEMMRPPSTAVFTIDLYVEFDRYPKTGRKLHCVISKGAVEACRIAKRLDIDFPLRIIVQAQPLNSARESVVLTEFTDLDAIEAVGDSAANKFKSALGYYMQVRKAILRVPQVRSSDDAR
jgi:hypothetical protein